MPTDPLRNSLVDQVTTQVLDFHQRRITNAHPSIDDLDYVVRKELRKLQEDLLKKVTALGGADTETHVFGVSGQVIVITNGFPPLIFEHSVQLVSLLTCFNNAPTGADFHADIRLRETGVTILSSQIVIPDGSTSVVEYTTFAKNSFVKNDVLLCDITQIGSINPGSMWTAYMLFDVIGG